MGQWETDESILNMEVWGYRGHRSSGSWPMLTIDTPSITTYLLTRSTVDGYKLILTSLLVLMGISNRSPAKNLSNFLQGIWLIGNEMSSGFNRMSVIKAEKPRTCHAASSGPTYSICKTIVRVLGVQRVFLWNESGWSWEIKGGQLEKKPVIKQSLLENPQFKPPIFRWFSH